MPLAQISCQVVEFGLPIGESLLALGWGQLAEFHDKRPDGGRVAAVLGEMLTPETQDFVDGNGGKIDTDGEYVRGDNMRRRRRCRML
jgi:hypothetical protein